MRRYIIFMYFLLQCHRLVKPQNSQTVILQYYKDGNWEDVTADTDFGTLTVIKIRCKDRSKLVLHLRKLFFQVGVFTRKLDQTCISFNMEYLFN